MEKGEERKKIFGNHTAAALKIRFDFGSLEKQSLFILGVIRQLHVKTVANSKDHIILKQIQQLIKKNCVI